LKSFKAHVIKMNELIVKCFIKPVEVFKAFSGVEPRFTEKLNQKSDEMVVEFLQDSVIQVFKNLEVFEQSPQKIKNLRQNNFNAPKFELPFPNSGYLEILIVPQNELAKNAFKKKRGTMWEYKKA